MTAERFAEMFRVSHTEVMPQIIVIELMFSKCFRGLHVTAMEELNDMGTLMSTSLITFQFDDWQINGPWVIRGSQNEKIKLNQTIICRDPDQTSRFCGKLIIKWCIKKEKSVKFHTKEKIIKIVMNIKRLAPNKNMI